MPKKKYLPYSEQNRKEICEKYLELLTEGLGPSDAARVCQVPHQTFEEWRHKDDEFSQKVFAARAAFKLHHLRNVSKGGSQWWAASAWMLERNFPEEFGQRSTVSLQGNVTDEMVKRLNAGRERAAKAGLLVMPKKDETSGDTNAAAETA